MKPIAKMLAAAVVVAGLLTGVNATPATAAPGPPAVSVKFNSTTATVSWGAVGGGVKNYTVIVSRDGFAGPFTGYTTTGTSINIAYKSFPYAATKSTKPFRFSVSANGSGWSSKTGTVKVSTTGTRVSTSNKSAAANKVMGCINKGAAAGLVAGTAAGVVSLATIWIPGANAVTASGYLAVMGTGAVIGYITCLAK